ncbi:hypothetical protein ACJ5H2_01260 [Nocardioides sp. R1-1]|uniref:hypothetical protein n=1 Tax=Nocardioides sp. R1-1 TaxID=3383502 RepID=UPI0038CF962E
MMARRRTRGGSPATPRPTLFVPPGCRELAEALIRDAGVHDAAVELGAAYARDGESLDACLADLDDTYVAVEGDTAPLHVVRATALSWADAMQGRYHTLSCADPLTGVSSVQHLQTQVAALYHAARDGWLVDADIARTHVLVVLELPPRRADLQRGFAAFEASLRRASAAELMTEKVSSCSQVAEVGPYRLVGLARRSPDLDRNLAAVVDELRLRLHLSPGGGSCRGWTEALPASPDSARTLLDELSR